MTAASTPASTPTGITNGAVPVSSPASTASAITPAPLPITTGSAAGLVLRMIPATIAICLNRPREAGSTAPWAALPGARLVPPGFFTMQVRIRAAAGWRDRRASAWPAGLGQAARRLPVEPARPVGGPDEGAGHHPGEPQAQRLVAERGELVGGHPPLHRVMARRRPQVLGDGEQVTAGRPQVRHRLGDLLRPLAQAEDQVGLGDQARVLGGGQHVEGALVAERRPDPPEHPGHGLDVVREHLRPRHEHLAEQPRLPAEVGDQQLDPAARAGAWPSSPRRRGTPAVPAAQGRQGAVPPGGEGFQELGPAVRALPLEVGGRQAFAAWAATNVRTMSETSSTEWMISSTPPPPSGTGVFTGHQ